MRFSKKRWVSVPLGTVLLLGACGDDSDGDDSETGSMMATTGAMATTGEEPGTTSAEGGPSDDESSDGGADESSGGVVACATDICATYGAAVPAVSEAIVMQAAADPMFMDDFAPLVAQGDEAVQDFIVSLANFISDAYGCTEGAYTGPSMEAAHTGLGITQDEYDAFIGLIAGVLVDAGVPDEDINACFAPPLVDPAFVSTIVGL